MTVKLKIQNIEQNFELLSPVDVILNV